MREQGNRLSFVPDACVLSLHLYHPRMVPFTFRWDPISTKRKRIQRVLRRSFFLFRDTSERRRNHFFGIS